MKLNVNSIKQRLQRLEQYIAELEKQQGITPENFKSDFTRQLAVERAFQAAIESCTDVAAHIVSVYRLGQLQESRDVYRFLVEAGYLDTSFGEAMMGMVAFRNRIVRGETVPVPSRRSASVAQVSRFRAAGPDRGRRL